jgi:hypothetical protein
MQNDILTSLTRLSDAELVARVKSLVARERDATAHLVAHLAELDTRDVHLREGYESLYVYCRDALGLSEGEAGCTSGSGAETTPERCARRPSRMDRSRSRSRTCSRTSWPAVPRPPLAPQESSLNPELAYLVFLEMADWRAAITGEQKPIPGGIPFSHPTIAIPLARKPQSLTVVRLNSSTPAMPAQKQSRYKRGNADEMLEGVPRQTGVTVGHPSA